MDWESLCFSAIVGVPNQFFIRWRLQMKNMLLAGLLLWGFSLFTCEVVRADEVTAQITLPRSQEPGRGFPPCGDPDAITPADVILEGLTSAADSYIGYPVVSGAMAAAPGVEPWVKSRLVAD